MRVFIAGATGVIGRHLVRELTATGHEVTGMTRHPERAQIMRSAGARATVCDALDAGAVREAVVAARPEAVIDELTELPVELHPRKYRRQLQATNSNAKAKRELRWAPAHPSWRDGFAASPR